MTTFKIIRKQITEYEFIVNAPDILRAEITVSCGPIERVLNKESIYEYHVKEYSLVDKPMEINNE